MRDEQGVLRCPECDEPVPGVTGLDEIENVVAHAQEVHDLGEVDLLDAIKLRGEWEAAARVRA